MSEFGDMLKEALVGDEPFRAAPERKALEESVRKFERRIKAIRFMAFFAVTFMTIVTLGGLIPLLRATDDTSGRSLAIYVLLVLFGSTGIGWGKMWFAMMVNHIAVIKELKVIQVRILMSQDHTDTE